MKLKHLFFGALIPMLGTALMSCSSEEPNGGQTSGKEGNLHAKIQLYLPTGTRSFTTPDDENDYEWPTNSSDGYEIGQSRENNVKEVTVVLAVSDGGKYKPVAVSTTSAQPVTPVDDQAPVFSILFRQDEIVEAAGQEVYIFAFCNASEIVSESALSTDDFVDHIINLTSADKETGIWKSGSFLMANAPNTAIPTKTLPAKESLAKDYNTPEKALDLGVVDVARAASRFDFKQTDTNLYPVFDVNEENKVEGNQMADVKMLAIAPINIAREFYLLPRVSNDGTDTNWKLCGVEHRNNWVVSPNWDNKTGSLSDNPILAKYFYQSPVHTYTDETYYKFDYLSTFAGEDDDDANWGSSLSADQKQGYKIWRYVTENTLPSIASQNKAISTGVLFKAEIVNPKAGSTLAEAMATGRDIYSYNGTIYGNVVALRKVAASLVETAPLHIAFKSVFGDAPLQRDEEGNFLMADETLTDCTSTANNGTFKIYRATNEGGNYHYYVYYLYRNRHNDNGRPNERGLMEFATVRNNIYKLAVTTVNEFGHPGDPGDDPDPEDPDDPDEDTKTYLKVSCRVVPWMVRVNNIEF